MGKKKKYPDKYRCARNVASGISNSAKKFRKGKANQDLKNIAKSVNYTVYKIMTENGLQRILTKIQNIPGPIMIIIKIEENTHVSKRVSLNTIKIRDRFMNFLKK